MLCGARKLLTSAGTVTLPPSLASRAATRVGNLAFPTPIRGIRYPGAQPGSVLSSSRSSPPYAAPRPSSLTHALPGSAPSTRSLTPCSAVTTSLKARSHAPLVRVQRHRVSMLRHRLLQRHARSHAGGRRGIVDDHGCSSRAVDDDDRPALKQRLPMQRYLDPQVSDEYAGDSHVASPVRQAENSMRSIYRTYVLLSTALLRPAGAGGVPADAAGHAGSAATRGGNGSGLKPLPAAGEPAGRALHLCVAGEGAEQRPA